MMFDDDLTTPHLEEMRKVLSSYIPPEPVKEITLNEYQDQAGATFKYTNSMGMPMVVFTALGLNEEAGEVAGKTKKYYRDNIPIDEARVKVALELGDTLWYLSQCARLWGYTLQEIAQMNIDKLASRHARNVIHGSGDNR